jgi:hypothetical protein
MAFQVVSLVSKNVEEISVIVEAIVLGITTVFVSSLVFANTIIKRQRAWDLEDERPEPTPEPEPAIDPYLNILIGTPCPKCSREAKDASQSVKNGYSYAIEAEGPTIPRACFDKNCKARKYSHLHMRCHTCKMEWFMHTADAVKKEEK